MKVLQFTLLWSAVYSSSGRNLVKLKTLERSARSFKRGEITILNDLDEFVRVSVQAGIQKRSSLKLHLVSVRSLEPSDSEALKHLQSR